MRYERKYDFSSGYENLIKCFLLSKSFKEIYEIRTVNSLYYDDFKYSLYYESVNGISNREKIRARFYNSGKASFNLERKIKVDELNTKKIETNYTKNLIPFVGLKFNGDLKLPKKVGKIYFPKVFISYIRRYFLSPDKKVRITIDQKIDCHKVKVMRNSIEIGNKRQIKHGILEIKYAQKDNLNENFTNQLTNNFNLILCRSSKYCQSVEILN